MKTATEKKTDQPTLEELIAQEEKDRKKFEAEKTAFKLHDGREVTIAEARKIMEKMWDEEDWRNPCAAFVPHQLVEAACKSIEFYHGAKAEIGGIQPLTGKVLVESPGYACW